MACSNWRCRRELCRLRSVGWPTFCHRGVRRTNYTRCDRIWSWHRQIQWWWGTTVMEIHRGRKLNPAWGFKLITNAEMRVFWNEESFNLQNKLEIFLFESAAKISNSLQSTVIFKKSNNICYHNKLNIFKYIIIALYFVHNEPITQFH